MPHVGRSWCHLILTALIGWLLALPAHGGTRAVDLRDAAQATIKGAYRVSEGGDVNGDRRADVLVADCRANAYAGTAWVFFGPLKRGYLDVTDPNQVQGRGFRIDGADSETPSNSGDFACNIDSGGDVNGDGLDDILVGAPEVDNNGRSSSGTVYVVFGKTSTESVRLKDFDSNTHGNQGFRIDGAGERHLAGGYKNLAGLGDVNGDGLDDIAVGAPFGGSVYVVFGKKDSLPVDLLTFDLGAAATRGYRIDTPVVDVNSQLAVAAAGDANGDRLSDVAIGVTTNRFPHSAYIVFGKKDPFAADIRRLGDGGYKIGSPSPQGGAFGSSLAGLGDVNGDALSDLIVSAPALFEYRRERGEETIRSVESAFVVFGQKSTETITAGAGNHGYQIRGASRTAPGDGTADVVAAAGDVNGDRVPDALISAARATHNGRTMSGSAYVVFGKKDARDVNLRSLGRRGFRIDGPRPLLTVGEQLAGPGNVIGDRRNDLLIGSAALFVFAISGRA